MAKKRAKDDRPRYRRGHQPQCGNTVDGMRCNHMLSFHGGAAKKGACRALGCPCPEWVEANDHDSAGVAIA